MPRTKSGKIKSRSRKACDDCRVRKIKCDGLEPCLTCSIYERVCSYTTRNGHGKASLAVYVLELEKKNRLLENLLQTARSQADENSTPAGLRRSSTGSSITHESDGQDSDHSNLSRVDSLETMIEATGRLSMDDGGNYVYHGHSAGLNLLEGIRELCSQMLQQAPPGKGSSAPFNLPKAFDHPYLPNSDPIGIPQALAALPAKDVAQRLVEMTLDDACCLITLVHRPTFNELFDRIYCFRPDLCGKEEQRFLPVLYGVLAVGHLFSAERDKGPRINGSISHNGIAYFNAARNLVDLTNCSDLSSLQAVLFIVMYLQCSGRLSACHSYLSIAIAASLRMGLHRSAASKGLDPVEKESRKRVFWALQTMDTYITTMLGLPKALGKEDIDQELPLEVHDVNIRQDGIRLASDAQSSNMAAVNAHTRLVMIMSKIVNHLFPIKGGIPREMDPYRVDSAMIIKIENELEEWFNSIASEIDTNGPDPLLQIRAQLRLRLAYAHVQMVLYRPFLHHIIRKRAQSPVELRSYACASACLKAAMQVIWLVGQLESQGLLAGSYWLTVYMTLFASMSLLMFALGNCEDPTVPDALMAAEKGRKVLVRLADGNATAQSCAATLTNIFQRIPSALASQFNVNKHPEPSGTADLSEILGKRVKAPLHGLEEARSQEKFMELEGYLPEDNHPSYLPNSMAGGIDLRPAPVDQSSILQALETSSMTPPPDLNGYESSLNLQANISVVDVLSTTSQQDLLDSRVSDLSFQGPDFMFKETDAQAYGNWEGL